MIAILAGAAMMAIHWSLSEYVNGHAFITVMGRVIDVGPPFGFLFYFGVYLFAGALMVLGVRKLMGGRF